MLSQIGQETVRRESTPGHRLEVDRFLVDVDFRLEADFRDGHEGLASIADVLGFELEGGASSYRVAEPIFSAHVVF